MDNRKSICILSAYEANRAWKSYREVKGRSDDADEDDEEEDDDEEVDDDDDEEDNDEKMKIYRNHFFFNFFNFFIFFR